MTRAQHIHDQVTSTFTCVVSDAETGVAAIIDPLLDLDYASSTLGTRSADEVVEHIRDHNLSLRYIFETRTHADHLPNPPYIREQLGGEIVIGSMITTVEEIFAIIFAEGGGFRRDGSQFDLCCSTAIRARLVASKRVPSKCPATHPPAWLI